MDDQPSDAELICRSRADPEAFAAIFERHFDAVHRYLDRRLGRDAAADRASEVFRIAYEGRARFDLASDGARPWLFGIATNLILKERRRERRHLRALERMKSYEVGGLNDFERVEDRLAAAQEHAALMRALPCLDDRDRDVLTLIAWEGLGYQEVAEALAIPVGTVRSRLNRARAQLRELLDLDGNEGATVERGLTDRGTR